MGHWDVSVRHGWSKKKPTEEVIAPGPYPLMFDQSWTPPEPQRPEEVMISGLLRPPLTGRQNKITEAYAKAIFDYGPRTTLTKIMRLAELPINKRYRAETKHFLLSMGYSLDFRKMDMDV